MSEQFKAGNFRLCYDEWCAIGANSSVLEWIKDGVKIPWSQTPQSFVLPNRQFSIAEELFLDKEISALLQSGAITECKERPLCVSPIGCVPKKNKSFRLVTDLR